MRTFENIQDILGTLPAFPKLYLLGTTGAGKTTIVRQILGTTTSFFPTVTQSRTTVAPTEYVLSRKLPFQATFIFKNKIDIENSIDEILEATILKIFEQKDSDELFLETQNRLEETPDERFRLKYIVDENFLQEIATEIISLVLESDVTDPEIFLQLKSTNTELNSYKNSIITKIEEKVNAIDINFQLFTDNTYIHTSSNKKDFIEKIKIMLKSEKDSISPIIEYARIQGDLLASWIPNDIEVILIDGEGIGHNMKEGAELSTRHLDYFNFVDKVILVERADNPFLSGGLNAIKKITLDGYLEKFFLIFSKLDLIEAVDKKRVLSRRLSNLTSALKENQIDFNLKSNQKYYLSGTDKKILDDTQNELIKLLKTLKKDFEEQDQEIITLKYDFDVLFSNLNTDIFFNKWNDTLSNEHWAIIKAFNKRLVNNSDEYRYLKPISDIHTFIMTDINIFLKKENGLETITYNSINRIKRAFSTSLLKYLKKKLLFNANEDLNISFTQYGQGSAKIRKDLLYKILTTYFPNENNIQQFNKFKDNTINHLIKFGAQKIASTKRIEIKSVTIKNLFGRFDFQYVLDKNINIIIGKNGTGKSTILKLIYSTLQEKVNLLDRIGKPIVELSLIKEYEDGSKKSFDYDLSKNRKQIDVELIDTFDMQLTESPVNKSASELDKKLMRLIQLFSGYLNELNSQYKEQNQSLKDEFEILINSDNVDINKIKENNESQKSLKTKVYNNLEIFKNIINSLFQDTQKEMAILDDGTITFNISGTNVSSYHLSSGEKQILIIYLIVLLKENKPYVLLMDEPEISLHVEWQTSLIDNIQRLNNNIQLVIATHNPLIMLGRKAEEITILEKSNDEIKLLKRQGTESLDISSTLLTYFGLSSLVSKDMQNEIREYTQLKLKGEDLANDGKERLSVLKANLENTVASNFIYNRHYFQFLEFLQTHKNIDFDKFESLDEDNVNSLLEDFGNFFHD
jgi:ABC-type Mn2+/Zn2+ transport system ATPase subunit